MSSDGIEGYKDGRRKMLVVQKAIQDSKDEDEWDHLTSILGSFRRYSKRGGCFEDYKKNPSETAKHALEFFNEYLSNAKEELFTDEDLKEIYIALGRK